MHGRDLTSILDLTPGELEEILDVALAMKRDGVSPVLNGRTLALIFEKPSLRTRVSFEVAMTNLGGRAVYLEAHQVKMGDREPVRDVARVLTRMVHGIAARTFAHETVVELGRWADVPVINALSDLEHPCQALADLLTLREQFGSLRGVRLAYVGDGNNVARSLAYASMLAGIDLVVASPAGFELPAADVVQAWALPGGGSITLTTDPVEAVQGSAVVYTDVWTSMGQESEAAARREHFAGFQVNAALMAHAPNALVMHDLPAHRGEEITDEMLESERSVVFDQAENRMFAQQAVLSLVMGDSAA
ncbi:MAG: ornithine carbamoyltransferase [Dehalococcoidia bacterium]|nr:ornithine carbamoyltransferase [Dehalococcoidia bacterium]